MKDIEGVKSVCVCVSLSFRRVSSLSDLLMVLVTTVWLLITHAFHELLLCGNLNNVLVCLDDLPDKILTISQYNGKTIQNEKCLKYSGRGAYHYFSLDARILKYWLSCFCLILWWNPRKIEIWIILLPVGTIHHRQEAGICNKLLNHNLKSVRLPSLCYEFVWYVKEINLLYTCFIFSITAWTFTECHFCKMSVTGYTVWEVNNNVLCWHCLSDFSGCFPLDYLQWHSSPLK